METDSATSTPSPVTAPSRPSSASLPIREDCWTEDATFTLVEAWGDRYLELKRGNLRQKDWWEVADAVNSRHGNVNRKSRRTDIQCKNRIDTLKKKYKVEKARVLESNTSYRSPWPFFDRLDDLIGATYKSSTPVAGVHRKTPQVTSPAWALSTPVPVAPRSGTQKRPSPAPVPLAICDSNFRRNFSAFAAAAAAAAREDEVEERECDDSGDSSSRSRSTSRNMGGDSEREVGYRELAHAIEKFGDIYQRVEVAKQMQMIELEKQRMQFAKDLEHQRMQLFMETQVQIQKIKRAKRASRADSYS